MLMNFLELVKARYSARKYAGRSVEIEKLEYIMECVRLAPSAVNFQPWRFKIVTDEPTLKALQQCYKREWLATAPCIIVACTNHEESWHRRADNKDHADIDIAIAVEHLCLAATEQGLGTCWVCNFDASQCSTVLGLPEYIEPAVLIPVGYAEDEPVEKKRKMLNEILFYLKSATKLFSVLLASKRPLITELADKLRLKYPLLPTISPCPTMRLEAIRSIIPISCRRYPKSV